MPHKGRKKMAFGPAQFKKAASVGRRPPRKAAMAPPKPVRRVRGAGAPSGPVRGFKGLQEQFTDPAALLPPLLRVAIDAFRAHLKETGAGRPRPAPPSLAPPSLAPPAPPAPPRPARPALRRTAPPRLRGGQTRLTPRQLRDPRER
jgi:hypothetical protein